MAANKYVGNQMKLLNLDDLPDELLLKVFACLPRSGLLALSGVSQRWNRLARDQSLWPENAEFSAGNSFAGLVLGGGNVKRVVLSYFEDVNPILRRVARCCPNLEELVLNRSDVPWMDGDEEEDPWKMVPVRCLSLRSLVLKFIYLSDEIMELIVGASGLETLRFLMCNQVTYERIVEAVANKPALRVLELNGAEWSDSTLHAVLTQCKGSLRALYGIEDVSSCSFGMLEDTELEGLGVNDACDLPLDPIGRLAPHLRILKLSSELGVPERFLDRVTRLLDGAPEPFTQLRFLSLCTPGLDDARLDALTRNLEGLETLVLESPSDAGVGLTDCCFSVLRRRCPRLRCLALVKGRLVTGSGILDLVARNALWPDLEGLYVSLPELGSDVLGQLAAARPSMKITNVTRQGILFSHPDESAHAELWMKCFECPDLSDYAGPRNPT